MKDNQVLKKLFNDDQEDRNKVAGNPSHTGWNNISRRDAIRKNKALGIIKNKGVKTGLDHYSVALLFQHGDSVEDYKLAQKYAMKSMDMGIPEAKWLYAATTDRLLRAQGKKQKFGTQYMWIILKEGEKYYDAMILQPYDKRTTDAVRAEYNVPPLAKLKRLEKKRLRKN